MAQKQTGRFCAHCQERVLAVGRPPNHLLHFVLGFFTFGLWWIVWLLLAIGTIGNYRCSKCGSRV